VYSGVGRTSFWLEIAVWLLKHDPATRNVNPRLVQPGDGNGSVAATSAALVVGRE
jgi:hypothetical protein